MGVSSARREEVTPAAGRGPGGVGGSRTRRRRLRRAVRLVLPVAPEAAEPDDGAYHASIVAVTEGHFLTLSTAQALDLARKLGDNPAAPRTNGSSSVTGGGSARRIPAIRSWLRPSRRSESSAGRRCSSEHSLAWACSSAAAAGSGPSAVSQRSACTARPAPPLHSPGAITCRRSPTPRSSRQAPDSCCGRFWRPKRDSGVEPGSASRASWHSNSQPSFVTPNVVVLGCAV